MRVRYKDMNKEKEWLLREKYGGKETEKFAEDVKHIEDGEPIDYVIGFSTFLGARIDLSFLPLIPRAETEFWVNETFKALPAKDISILDIFAGSGCIGIGILKNIPSATADFAEKDPLLIKQIQKNLEINAIPPERASVFESDVFQSIPQKKYDYIFANPPYISPKNIHRLQNSVLEYEPREALFADEDGLFFIKKLIVEASEFLTPDGKMFIEFDDVQKEEIEQLLSLSLFRGEFTKDQFGKWRTVLCTLKTSVIP